MSIEIESHDGDVHVLLSTKPTTPKGHVEMGLRWFFTDPEHGEESAIDEEVSTFPIRDLLIALHALSASTDTATSDSSEKHASGASPMSDKPRYRNFRTPWRRK